MDLIPVWRWPHLPTLPPVCHHYLAHRLSLLRNERVLLHEVSDCKGAGWTKVMRQVSIALLEIQLRPQLWPPGTDRHIGSFSAGVAGKDSHVVIHRQAHRLSSVRIARVVDQHEYQLAGG